MDTKTGPVDMGKPTLGESKTVKLLLTMDEARELVCVIKYHKPLSAGNFWLKETIIKQLEAQK